MKWYKTASKAKYVGQCDALRRAGGEEAWQQMMGSMEKITMQEFMAATQYEAILDEDPDMTPETMLAEQVSDDPDAGFYRSNWKGTPAYFMQHAGFEFIFA